MRVIVATLGALVACAWCAAADAAPCYDIGAGEPRSLSGTIEYHVFPGPPGYSDIQQGDTPEPRYVLHLDAPICIRGDEFADPHTAINRVQLAGNDHVASLLKASVGRHVRLSLTDPIPAQTGHMHEPLVEAVTSVIAAGRDMDFTDEYGTPATTIRAFYETLADGQGEAASAMVVPEKRSGPFAAANLTRFYGHLREPIRLIGIEQTGPSAFVAHYHFATANSVCDGRAVVTTVVQGGRNYIQSIRALNGC